MIKNVALAIVASAAGNLAGARDQGWRACDGSKKWLAVNKAQNRFLKHCCTVMALILSCSYFSVDFCQDGDKADRSVTPTQAQINDAWSKFVILISRKDGFVNRSDFEDAFHMKFKSGHTRNNVASYVTHQGRDWLLTVGLTNDVDGNGPSSSLGIDFKGMGAEQSSKNPCLATKEAFGDLKKKGWLGEYDENMMIVKLVSPNKSYQAIIHYSRDCIYSVLVGKPHFFNNYIQSERFFSALAVTQAGASDGRI